MQKILILGGNGMLGHKAYQIFTKEFDTWVTFRNYDARSKKLIIFNNKKVINNVDAFSFESIKKTFELVKPNVVLNCVGIIKQLNDAKNPKISIYVNSLLPHLLSELCKTNNTRLIHISSDCVFSGKKGMYTEDEQSDAEDLYGRSKFLGEVNYPHGITLRTSIIGHELFSKISLVDWFISQEGKIVSGYTNAIYTGFPTVILVKEIIRIIKEFPELHGLYNISSEKISKYELLQIIKEMYNLKIEIKPYHDFNCDRSLDSTEYRKITGFVPPKWGDMIEEMYSDYLNNKIKGIYNV